MIFGSQIKVLFCISLFFNFLYVVVNDEHFESFAIKHKKIFLGRKNKIAFLRNIHKSMRPDEIEETFGTAGLVPEYHPFSVDFSSRRKKREINDKIIKITINFKGALPIYLNLKPTDGLLANRSTPVWLAHTDSEAQNGIRYRLMPNAMKNIGKFKMYHDLENQAALIFFWDRNDRLIVQGIVTQNYVVKSLPKRFRVPSTKKHPKKVLADPPLRKKRLSEEDEDEITEHYLLVKVEPPSENDQYKSHCSMNYPDPEERRRYPKVSKRAIVETIYPEILLVADHNVRRGQSLTEALRFMLAFWNAVDMIFTPLEKPRIRPNIAGIIISADDLATPYIAMDTSIKLRNNDPTKLDGMGRHFYAERESFPIAFDMIVGMTTIMFAEKNLDPRSLILGSASFESSCISKDAEEYFERIDSTAMITYSPIYAGVETAAHEIAHIIGVDHDDDKDENCKGFLMESSVNDLKHHFTWSPCSKLAFTRIISGNQLRCMYNNPAEAKPVIRSFIKPRINGTFTLDQECRIKGYQRSCKLRGISPCATQGCRTHHSNVCIVTHFAALSGSECHKNERCDERTFNCVRD